MGKMIRKIVKGLEIAILVVAISLVGFMFFGPRFGWSVHPVLSGSMEPALKTGGVIVTKLVPLEEIKVGDIICFQLDHQIIVAHRVIRIFEREGKPWFQTKGDANEEPDLNLVSSKGGEIAKVVFYLPYLGYLVSFVKSKLGFLIFVVILGTLIAWCIRDLWKAILEEKEKRKAKAISNK